MFPTIAEYNHAIQKEGGNAFKTLSNLTFIPSRTMPVRIYSYGSGSYAVVFKAKSNDREYAIRCFISAEKENIDRYRAIDNYLKDLKASWVTKIELLEDEINIGHRSYPVVKMEWVEGQLLNNFVNQILNNNQALADLQSEVINVSKSLESFETGHGDIQCGNIIVARNIEGKYIIKLIDYDGMFIPSFSAKVNLERGRVEFQHPERSKNTFDQKIDRFSFWVILTALEALKYDKTLWLEVMQGGFNTLDNLLFVGADFKSFNHSTLVNRLYALEKASLNFYLDKLNSFCNSSPESVVSPELFDSSSYPIDTSEKQGYSLNNETSSELQIITIPMGAAVLTSAFQRLGNTPLVIDKEKYLGQTLIISYGTQLRQVLISPVHKIVDITFTDTTTSRTTNGPISSEISEPNEEANKLPPFRSAVQKLDPVNDDSSWQGIGIFILTILIIAIIAILVNRGTSNNYSENSTASLVPIDTIDSVAEVEVPEATISDYIAATDTVNSILEIPLTDQSDSEVTARDAVMSFFLALSTRDCLSAWVLTYVKSWEENGQAWFCTSELLRMFKIASFNISTVTTTSTQAEFSVDYYAEDSENIGMCYKQYIKVEKISILGGPAKWMITEMANVESPYACNLTND